MLRPLLCFILRIYLPSFLSFYLLTRHCKSDPRFDNPVCVCVCIGNPILRLESVVFELCPTTQERSSLYGVGATVFEYVRTAAPVSAIPGSVYE